MDPAQLQQTAELASRLAGAQQALAAASQTARDVEKQKADAQAAADLLAKQAGDARARAASSAAFATADIRSGGSRVLTADPLTAALSSPGNLLQKLGAVDRLHIATAHRKAALAIAAEDAARATKLIEAAKSAADQAASIDLGSSQQAVAVAQSQVDAATAALASLSALQPASAGWKALINDPHQSTSGWVLPVHGPLTDGYGPRPSRPAGTALFHPGDDLGAACRSTIVAAHAGTVQAAGPNGSYGNFVLIDHGGGVQTAYGHIIDGGIGVSVGQTVAAGQPIALVGSTGASTGCHLHFEVRVNGVQIDPLPFMAARGVTLGVR